MTEAAIGGVLYKRDVLRNFAKFKGKHLCQSLFFNKVAGLNTLSTENVRTTASEMSIKSVISLVN